MSVADVAARVAVRDIVPGDLDRVVEIDARHRGSEVPDYWRGVRDAFLAGGRKRVRVALGAEVDGRLAGFLFGEVRAFEFGSQPCGWIFAVGVEPAEQRAGIASTLLAEACRRFHAAGIAKIRTMVRRADVPVLAFFRAHGFAAGEFTQLELELPTEGR
jgi:ribosomal protein S18 acetylase RimI-like enzyme